MKIGILTFHRAINYGASLQAYALTKKMNEMGYEAEIVDYRNPHIENMFHNFSINKINSPKKTVSFFLGFTKNARKKRLFKKFWKMTPTSKMIFMTSNQLKNANYDMFVTGSDQVWNPDCTKYDKTYFLDFAENSKKNAYAASFGVSVIDEKYRADFNKLLGSFQNISVRETRGAEIVKDFSGRESTVVLDPTLLLNKKQWMEIASPTKYSKGKYVLVYMLVNSKSLMDFALKLGKEKNLPVVCIGNGRAQVTYASDIGPREFVKLFDKAEYVVTNSFHGTAFSINFNKNFFVELHNMKNSRNSRMEEVLNLFGLSGRLIINGECAEKDTAVDYSHVNAVLEQERAKSEAFLEKIVK